MSRTLAVSATMLVILFLTPSTGSAQDNVQEVEAAWARALVAGDQRHLAHVVLNLAHDFTHHPGGAQQVVSRHAVLD